METTPSGEKAKVPKIRSVAYPSRTIQFCLDLTSKIDAEFTSVVYTPREDISKAVGSSGGALDRAISSCVQYGLLELKSKEGYKPTDLFKKIKKPLPDEKVIDFVRETFNNPELYKKLIAEFNNKQLPTVTGLANILDRKFDVKGDAATLASRVFLTNVEYSEALGENNTLLLDSDILELEDIGQDEGSPTSAPINEQPTLKLLNPPSQQINTPVTTKELPVFLKNGREAKVILPIDFTDEDMKRINKVLKAYLSDDDE